MSEYRDRMHGEKTGTAHIRLHSPKLRISPSYTGGRPEFFTVLCHVDTPIDLNGQQVNGFAMEKTRQQLIELRNLIDEKLKP